MKIKTTPMRTVTYFGADIKIPAHHIAVAADANGCVYSYDATPIEITTAWLSSEPYLISFYTVPARVDFAETIEWRNSLQLYPLTEANKMTAANLNENLQYRLKPEPPKTIRIGEYDVPEPVREPLEKDTEYWIAHFSLAELADSFKWYSDKFDNWVLKNGLIHLTKEAAVIHAEALLSLTKAAEREKPRCPDSAPRTEATPHEIIQNLLTKGMAVWACVSDKSYDEARAKIGRHAYRVTRCSTDSCYPVWTWYAGWKYAIPIDTATMTEITEVPK